MPLSHIPNNCEGATFIPRFIIEAAAKAAGVTVLEAFGLTAEKMHEENLLLRTTLVNVLGPFPEARTPLARAILELSRGPHAVWWAQ